MLFADIAIAASNHNRLVITAALTGEICLESSKVATDIGAAKFVIKGGATNGTLSHNIQGRHNAVWLAIILLPRLHIVGNLQI